METLVKVSELKAELLFSDSTGEMDRVIERITEHVKPLVFDVQTAKGRAEIASLAHRISKSKVALEAMGKEYVSELKTKSKIVDVERKKMRDTLDLLRVEVRAPLTEYENQEKLRVEKIQERLDRLETFLDECDNNNLEQLRSLRIELDSIKTDDSFDEFKGQAERHHARASELLNAKITAREKYEAEQAELKRLKDAEDKRLKDEREEKIRAEAAAKARLEAEEKARQEKEAEAVKVAEEKAKLQAEKDTAEREKIAAEEREKLEKERAEKAEREKIAAEKQAEIDRMAAIAKAENEKAQAIKDEQLRAAKKAAEKIEREKRDADKRKADEENHRKVNNEAKVAIFEAADVIDDEAAKAIVSLIAMGKIPHVFIRY